MSGRRCAGRPRRHHRTTQMLEPLASAFVSLSDVSPQRCLSGLGHEPRKAGGGKEPLLASYGQGQGDEEERGRVDVEARPVALARLVVEAYPGMVEQRVQAVAAKVR